MKVYEFTRDDGTKYKYEYDENNRYSNVEIHVNDKYWGVPYENRFVKELLIEIEKLGFASRGVKMVDSIMDIGDSKANNIQYNSVKIEKRLPERDIPKEVICKSINNGISITGEYDVEYNMYCPNCEDVVGDYEAGELYYKYCPECGQRLKYTATEE